MLCPNQVRLTAIFSLLGVVGGDIRRWLSDNPTRLDRQAPNLTFAPRGPWGGFSACPLSRGPSDSFRWRLTPFS